MKVGILYNLVEELSKGRESDKIADNEVIDTAKAVQVALEDYGLDADLVKLNSFDINSSITDIKKSYDFVFNIAEGIDGDNLAESLIAKTLKKSSIPFSGSDHLALSKCVAKEKTKEILVKNNISTPKYIIFKNNSEIFDIKDINYPVIVKPIHEDGSIGISSDSVVRDFQELKKKVEEILDLYKQPVLVEEYIDGREINASVIGNGKNIEVLPLSEITFNNFPENIPKILSFDAKWMEDSVEYKNTIGKCPAELDENLTNKIIELAKKAFRCTGCKDYARVDFRIRDNEPYVIEVNPNPCINPQGAGFIRSANSAGYSYNDIIYKILKISLDRYKISMIMHNK